MSGNSIRGCLSKEDTISEIILSLGHNPNATCVVVEGESDIRLFKSILSDSVELFQSYSGKHGIEDIVVRQFQNNKRVIGIRDRDYERIKKQKKRMFFCDYCCAEMMIISDDYCYNRIYNNVFNDPCETSLDNRIHILKTLLFMSLLRKNNEEKKWGICIKDIKAGEYYDSSTDDINQDELIKNINYRSDIKLSGEMTRIVQREFNKDYNLADYLNMTNGHDFISMFGKFCGPKKTMSNGTLETTLRVAFGEDNFQKTQLYIRLKEYQENKSVKIV